MGQNHLLEPTTSTPLELGAVITRREQHGINLMGMRIGFHGGTGTVTGSRFLIEAKDTRVLVDCGLFQGLKEDRLRNWEAPPFAPASLDAVLLSHAHVDHSGALPRLVREGYDGPIRCTQATRDLCEILLPDSARIQEEDARYANKEGFSKHDPALPLYTERDARAALKHFQPVKLGKELELGQLRADFREAGHLLGASSIEIRAGATSVLFSGDLGRDDDLLMVPPDPPGAPRYVVLESTYGDRRHPAEDPLEALAAPLSRVIERGGVALVPAFAVGRTQLFLHALHRLFEEGRIPRVPVFVDSPMATSATALYEPHSARLRLSRGECRDACTLARHVRSRSESKKIDEPGEARIILSASGMLSGGRVLHHLKVFGPHPENLILLPGYQAPGTRGAALAAGAPEVRVHGSPVAIRAEVVQLRHFSGHADQEGLLTWLERCEQPLAGVYLVHGEPASLEALRERIEKRIGCPVHVPVHGETVELD